MLIFNPTVLTENEEPQILFLKKNIELIKCHPSYFDKVVQFPWALDTLLLSVSKKIYEEYIYKKNWGYTNLGGQTLVLIPWIIEAWKNLFT